MTQELSAEQIQQVLQGISVLPQPQIIVDLQMEQFLPNPDLKTIAKLISQDPGLSGALLKIGLCDYRLGKLPEAERTLGEVIAKYPGTDVARTADDRLRAMRIAGNR